MNKPHSEAISHRAAPGVYSARGRGWRRIWPIWILLAGMPLAFGPPHPVRTVLGFALIGSAIWLLLRSQRGGSINTPTWEQYAAVAAGQATPELILSRIQAENAQTGHTVVRPNRNFDRNPTTAAWRNFGDALLGREQDVAAAATTNGWQFRPYDHALITSLIALRLLALRGREAGMQPAAARNIIVGDVDGVPFTFLDWCNFEWSRDDDTKKETFKGNVVSLVLMNFPTERPIAISPAGFAGSVRFADIGGNVKLESGEFNNKIDVYCDDPAWARLVLNPAVMQAVLDAQPLEVIADGRLLVLSRDGDTVPGRSIGDLVMLGNSIARSATAAKVRQ